MSVNVILIDDLAVIKFVFFINPSTAGVWLKLRRKILGQHFIFKNNKQLINTRNHFYYSLFIIKLLFLGDVPIAGTLAPILAHESTNKRAFPRTKRFRSLENGVVMKKVEMVPPCWLYIGTTSMSC